MAEYTYIPTNTPVTSDAELPAALYRRVAPASPERPEPAAAKATAKPAPKRGKAKAASPAEEG